MNRDQIYELARLNRKISRSIADLIKYIDDNNFIEQDELKSIVGYLLNINDILRRMNYEE